MPALVTVNVEPRSSSRRELARACALGQAPHLGAELVDRAAVAVAHDGNDEPGVGLHGNAEVVAVEEDDLVALEARVQLRELLQRLGARP